MNELSRPDDLITESDATPINPRHYELALAEQAMRRSSGKYLTIEEILRRNGFVNDSATHFKARGTAKEN